LAYVHKELALSNSHTVASGGPDILGGAESVTNVPHEPLGRLFLRFLKFGSLAWGGPVAQIAMIRQELVAEEQWVTPEQFNRVLAMYQVLPGPEAHELCVYFGMLSRGRIGGILAGLGFMLPSFILMFLLSWLYVRYGLKTTGTFAVVLAAVQAAVAALIVRAVHPDRGSCTRRSMVVDDRDRCHGRAALRRALRADAACRRLRLCAGEAGLAPRLPEC
jgi:hypothetical protein